MQRVLVKDRNLTTFVAGSFHATVGSLARNRTPELDEGTVESTRERDTEGGGDQHAETRQRRKEKHRLQLRNGNKSTHRERALDDSRAQAHRRKETVTSVAADQEKETKRGGVGSESGRGFTYAAKGTRRNRNATATTQTAKTSEQRAHLTKTSSSERPEREGPTEKTGRTAGDDGHSGARQNLGLCHKV